MKKQVKIIIGVVVLLAIAIAVASYFFPKPKGDETSGTIGKADKYRKDQMAAKDILLRDDILKDTAAVAKTLKQLIEFSVYSLQTKQTIDSNWIKPLAASCKDPQCEEVSKILREYSDFIGNNIPLMKKTNDILAESYSNPNKDLTLDVGFQLYSFISFIDQFVERDSVLDMAIEKLNKYLATDKGMDAKRKAEVAKLKKLKDRMVIDNLLFAYNTGDKKKYEYCTKQVVGTSETIGTIRYATEYASTSPGVVAFCNTVCSFPTAASIVGSINTAPTIGTEPVINTVIIANVFGPDVVKAVETNNVGYAINKPFGVAICNVPFGNVFSSSAPGIFNYAEVAGTIVNGSSPVYQGMVPVQN